MQTPVLSPMGSLLGQLKLVVAAVLGYVGDICSTITNEPVLLLTPFCVLVFCFCFAIVIRLIKGDYHA